jgi:cytochrome c551/c552
VLASSVVFAGEVDLRDLYQGDYRIYQNAEERGDYNGILISDMSKHQLRLAGLRMFTTPFRKTDGYGDGDDTPPSPTPGTNHEGERGSIQGNGTFQRINGLDAQTCLECHAIISNRVVPAKFGIGGVGGVNDTVLGAGGATFVDLTTANKQQNINGRVINPPFIFGAGGIELLANEMTKELNAQLDAAFAGGDGTYPLTAKGVSFGSVTIAAGAISTVDGEAIGVEGVFDARPFVNGEANDDFLVVAPFGRKGDNKSTRTFDIGALSFHFGMQIGDHDDDNDGKHFEVTEGELSALSIIIATAQTPFAKKPDAEAHQGRQLMDSMGCTECHIPKMKTDGKRLGFRFPEIGNNPDANVYKRIDLTKAPMNFKENAKGGITIPLFADLKRHYMGPSLQNFAGDAMFTTMRLWGVADTAPYLHDGRALTIRDAIVLHGADATSEANDAVTNFNNASTAEQEAVLAFLDTLRSPNGTFPYLLETLAPRIADQQGIARK